MSLLGRRFEARAVDPAVSGGVGWSDPAAIPPNSSFSRATAGVVVNDRTALQIMTVLACVRLNADVVAGFPMYAYKQQGRRRVVLDSQPGIVTDPFDNATPQDGRFQLMASLQLRGNAFALIVARDYLGYPQKLHILQPSDVKVRTNSGGQLLYEVNRRPVDPDDMVHLKWITLPGAVCGINPIEMAALDLGLALATAEFGARFFDQGAQLSGVLHTDKLLTKEQVRRTFQQWTQAHTGIQNAHVPAVLDAGLEWQPLSVPPEQAQFLATRAFQRGEIAMLWGIPPHLIGDVDRTTSWGKGIEEQTLGYLNFTVRSFNLRFEQAWSNLLPRGTNIRFDTKELLRTNMLARYQAYMIGRTAGFLSNDDIRLEEDLDPIPDGKGADYGSPLNSSASGGGLPTEGGDAQGGDNGTDSGDSRADDMLDLYRREALAMNGSHP